MSARRVIAGRSWLRVEDVAACYSVEVAWVREVCDLGLVEARREPDGIELVPAVELDRVADLLRISRALGLDLVTVASLF